MQGDRVRAERRDVQRDYADGWAADQTNFDNYRVVRMNEMPRMEIIRIESAESQGGVGEAVTAAAAPALTNAIYSACGRRLRALPVTRHFATTT